MRFLVFDIKKELSPEFLKYLEDTRQRAHNYPLGVIFSVWNYKIMRTAEKDFLFIVFETSLFNFVPNRFFYFSFFKGLKRAGLEKGFCKKTDLKKAFYEVLFS